MNQSRLVVFCTLHVYHILMPVHDALLWYARRAVNGFMVVLQMVTSKAPKC